MRDAGARRRHRRRLRRAGPLAVIAGALGEVMVTLACLLGAYAVWQTWWTSVGAVHQASQRLEQFRESTASAPHRSAVLRTDEPPVAPPVAEGETIGVLVVPRWEGLTRNAMPVVEGTSREVLDAAAAGRYPTSQQVGEVGNVALAGHRRTYGDSFRHVDELRPGDPVVIETASTWYVYVVTGHEIVLPSQWEVVAPVPHHPGTPPTERLLTLTTCHSPSLGEYGNSHRWVVHARFLGWLDHAEGTPPQLAGSRNDPG